LVGTSGGIHEETSVINLGNWIETIEERFEMSVFAVFANSGNSGSFWFRMSFDERFTNDKGVLFLFCVSLLSNPADNLLVELLDEAIVGIEMGSLKWSLGDFSAGDASALVRDFEKSVFHIWIISGFNEGVIGGWVDSGWLSSKMAPEFGIDFWVLLWEENISVAMSLCLSNVSGDF